MTALTGMRTGQGLLEDPRHRGDAKAAEALFDRIADRVSKDHQLSRAVARRALDQALIFVAVAAQDTSRALSPSPLVDAAWDTFLLYTVEYHHHCHRYGNFVHHTPNDNPDMLHTRRHVHSPFETATLLRAQGFRVLDPLWPRDAIAASKANCTSCYTGDHEGDDGPL